MNGIHGTWYDGQSSRTRAVRLHATLGRNLRAETEAGESHDWPLSALTISPRLGNTPRILRLPDGGRIECPDSPLLAQWFPRPSSRIEAFADWLERRRLAILGAAIATVLATVVFMRVGVPWMATEIAKRMPPAVERHVSGQVIALLERMYFKPTEVPSARRQALERGFRALVATEPRSEQMRLRIVRAPLIGPNAFALPDGSIFMTDELVELAESDEELLAVLAHEAGHHVHRHGMRQTLESSSVFVLAGMLFGDMSGSSLAVSIPAVLLSNGFSRGHEREADAYAFDLLLRKGHSPKAFASMMRRMSQEIPRGMEEGVAGYLSSHPPSPERIAAAERAARGE